MGRMKTVMENLYYGRYNAFERRPVRCAEHNAVNRKIEAEKSYFIQKMSIDDCARFEALETLYNQAGIFEEIDVFSYGFKMGVTLMCAVFADENEPGNIEE